MTPREHQLLSAVAACRRKLRRGGEARSCILCYHSVHPTLPFRSCTPELFRHHLEWLREHCRVRPLRELADPDRAPQPGEKPEVAITFDDGYADNFDYAAPALADYNVPATFFLTAGYVDRDPEVMGRFAAFRRVPESDLEPLTWTQVNDMARAGFDIQAHTYSHPNLYYLDRRQLEFEVVWAKGFLEEKLGRRMEGFAYTFGKPHCHFDKRAVEQVRAAGYLYAVAVIYRRLERRDSRLQLPRISVRNDSLRVLADKISGAWDAAGAFHDWCPRWLGRMLWPRGYREETYGPPYSMSGRVSRLFTAEE